MAAVLELLLREEVAVGAVLRWLRQGPGHRPAEVTAAGAGAGAGSLPAEGTVRSRRARGLQLRPRGSGGLLLGPGVPSCAVGVCVGRVRVVPTHRAALGAAVSVGA